MPTIRRPRLLKTDVLRGMKPSSIAALLSPYADYLGRRGITIAHLGTPHFDFPALSAVLAVSTEQTPPALVEQLDVLDLISNSQSTLNFEAEYHEIVQRLREPDDGAPDIAVKILLHAPDIALQEFDRQALSARRSLVSFRVKQGMPSFEVTSELIERFRAFVTPWFRDNARSGICHVHHLKEADGDAFVIRHGDLLKRIGIFDEDGNQDSCIVRPERVDVAHFNRLSGEWQVSGLGVKLQELYREAFGTVFHGSIKALAHSKRYSLEPLREGATALQCDLSATVQFAELRTLKLELPSGQQIVINRPPVFDALEHFTPGVLSVVPLVEASLSLKLANRSTRMPVRICPERDVVTGNNADPAIDTWLVEHGFANDDTRLLASA